MSFFIASREAESRVFPCTREGARCTLTGRQRQDRGARKHLGAVGSAFISSDLGRALTVGTSSLPKEGAAPTPLRAAESRAASKGRSPPSGGAPTRSAAPGSRAPFPAWLRARIELRFALLFPFLSLSLPLFAYLFPSGCVSVRLHDEVEQPVYNVGMLCR